MGHNETVVVRAEVPIQNITWARERSGIDAETLARRFPKLSEWESGAVFPTLKQLEKFAQATHTPVGYFFLSEPPEDSVPIPDFRTVAGTDVSRPSPDLLDTIYQCQQRQEWYRGYSQTNRIEGHSFVGSCTPDTAALDAAEDMRRVLSFSTDERGSTWSEAFRRLTENAEDSGILVMVNGVVGSNTRRKLDPMEFRGFALVDPLAPVVFVNGADTRAAQVFTLAHELAHIWLGQTGLDDIDPRRRNANSVERWCNNVAAEFLVPKADLGDEYSPEAPFTEELDRLARVFKVSTLVIVRRLHETGFFTWDDYRTAYEAELARVLEMLEDSAGRGGNFYNTQPVRVSKLFARSVIASTLEGQTLHRDAFRMLGFKKLSTFNELSHRLGVT